MQLSIIVPAYNEAPTIETIIRRIATVPIKKENLVVDDGSPDGTREILKHLQEGG
jgi:dolichol-phosphate mannosyltransferase